ncbi:hypothetical protein [Williamsia sp. 1135]|uniref:hypothetical protein n=1 Tax=Williamsia sp. 1135 TaxID=1889262 RepID=UPI000A0F48A7|nr:hypothetical protein [Williamsia sp. 1135]ORM29202.1 hypothetical protein BFL43_20430 [Williamsia sp. 1135]
MTSTQPTHFAPILPGKFSINEVDDFLDNNYQRALGIDAIKRIVKALNKLTFTDAIARMTALDEQVRAELDALPQTPAAVHQLRTLAPPEDLVIDIDPYGTAEHPWFTNRPAWSDPGNDHLDLDDGTTCRSRSFWSSEQFSIPCPRYASRVAKGKHQFACLTTALVQPIDAAEPYITLDRKGWNTTTGEPIHPIHHKFELNEAVTFAHLLLSLVDLASGDDVGE